jgi:LAS superfamily LD-carboxypeptidase LdcB
MNSKKRRTVHKKGPRRHLRKSFVIGVLVVVLAIVGIVKIPGIVTRSKLRSLGYSDTTAENIEKEKLSGAILKNGYYSDYLAKCIDEDNVRKEYLSLYALVDTDRGLSDADFLLYHRLEDLGYEADQIEDLYSNLYFWEITPLLMFDYQWDETEYIKDCIKNRTTNNENTFILDGNYLTDYKNVTITTDVKQPLLINHRYGLDASYVPSDLTDISVEYAAQGQQMTKEAATAFLLMAKSAMTNGHAFFASSTYVSYEDQQSYYKMLVSQVGSSNADYLTDRPGYNEHQTGLAVNISATYEDNSNITSTELYQWLTQNCTKYGFILRYPAAKKDITHVSDEDAHLLYVGKDLAKKITDSKLTWDEYYLLYYAPWYDEKCMPGTDIVDSTGCVTDLQSAKEETSPSPSASTAAQN